LRGAGYNRVFKRPRPSPATPRPTLPPPFANPGRWPIPRARAMTFSSVVAAEPPARSASSLLFVSVPLSGHLNPTLAVAAAAAARQAAGGPPGGRVRVAGLSRSRAKVQAAGLEFLDLGEPEAGLAAAIAEQEANTSAPPPARGGAKEAVAHSKVGAAAGRVAGGGGRGGLDLAV
jgi:hypothetical protein